MKKSLKISIAFIALVITAMPATAQEIAPFTDYLPADTFLVISVPQTAELKAFIERPEIKRLLDLVMNQPEFAEGFAEFKQEFHTRTGITTEEIYERLSGDMTIAMLSFPDNNKVPDMLVTFGMRGGSAAISNDLNRVIAASSEDGKEVKRLNIAGHEIYGIEDEDAYFAEAFGHFTIASTPAALERLFGDAPRINAEPGFARHRELVGLNEGISMYLNLSPLNRMLEFHFQMEMEKGDDAQAAAGKAILDEFGLDNINGISVTVPLKPNSAARMFVHAPDYDGFLAKIFSTEAVDRNIITGLDARTDSLVSFTLQEPNAIMDYFFDLAMKFNPNMTPESVDGTLEMFKQQTGIDIRSDLIGSLGTTVAFGFHLLEDASLDFARNPFAMFQSFEFDMLWQLKNRAGLEVALTGLLTAISEQMPDAFLSEEYKGSTIHSLAWGIPGGASLAMAVHDGYMRLATRDADSLKALIDGLGGDANLAATMGFRQAAQKIPAGANMFSYVSPGYYRKYIELSLDMLPEVTEETPEGLAQFLTVLRDGAMKVAAKERSYTGYTLPMTDGLYGEGEIDLADQLYVFMLEMTKYLSMSDHELDETAD